MRKAEFEMRIDAVTKFERIVNNSDSAAVCFRKIRNTRPQIQKFRHIVFDAVLQRRFVSDFFV
jgi:hypothetical protein